ncbi:MAG: acetate--CoA ligase family protein [Proteobacteria bacterium]|nr:acetate--CoA ligase family protein [Pseudomonadota bacterium]
MAHSLDPLMRPQSVAVIGASDEPARIGGRPVYSMLAGKYQGRLYPVNPSRDTVQGLKAYASIKDVPETVDSAVISVPASVAVDVIRECAEAGVKSAVVFTSGFAEIGDAGLDGQAEIARIAQQSGMRIVGPNCLGVFTLDIGWFGTFANTLASLKVPNGPIGIVTQSGAYGGHLFTISQNRGVGTNHWVTTGNEVDVDVAEVIEYYAQVDSIRVIVAYAEGVRSAERMCRALDMARRAEKPVIFMKVGSTEAGARAAASHTASLAGADAVYDGLFRQYGAYRAETTEEMADIAYACQFGRYPKGNKIGLQTISGGVGVQLADASTKRGFEVTPLPQATQRKILDLIPFAGVNNPVDFTGQVLNERRFLEDSMRYVIDEGGYDSQILYMASLPVSQFTGQLSLEVFTALREQYPEELMIMSMIATPEGRKKYEDLGYPCFEDHSLAVRAMAGLRYFGEVFERGQPDAAPALPRDAEPAPSVAVSEHAAKRIIASAGIPVARETLADSAEACVTAWKDFAGPVVMKIASPDLPHKTEIGGVLLNINDEQSIRDGHATLIERARTAKPDARIDGVIVAEMIKGGVETVMGVVRDPVFGPVVMFGIGGVFVEVLKDVTFRIAPFGVDEAHRMIDQIRGRAMLDGVRGAPPSDIAALADALSRLSVFAAANAESIESIDVNPFIVLPKGAAAVDALIVPGARD